MGPSFPGSDALKPEIRNSGFRSQVSGFCLLHPLPESHHAGNRGAGGEVKARGRRSEVGVQPDLRDLADR